MSNSNQEQERLRRLRERQLTDRDPQIKQREFYRASNQRERRSAKPYTLAEAWAVIPHLWKMPFYALLLGVILLLVLTSVWISFWAWVVGGAVTLFFIIIGFLVGQALDMRDKLRDYSK
jgi:hypothetical protein